MSASTTIFDIEVRVIECPNCGAPLQCARVGGTVQCGYCQASCVVRARHPEQVARKPPSAADEVVRLARLTEQVRHPTSGHAYDLTTPPAGFAPTGASQQNLLGAWQTLKAEVRAEVPVSQHRVCWLAVQLADSYFRSADEPRGRATLETALDLLSDPAHQQLLSCRLAWEAAKRGDVNAAIGWLGECNPAPELLELDSEYRAARARLALARNLPDEVFQWVGAAHCQVPEDDSHWDIFWALRVAADEARGNMGGAIATMKYAAARGRPIDTALETLGMALEARAAWRHLQTRTRVLTRLFAAMFLGGIFAWIAYVVHYIRGG